MPFSSDDLQYVLSVMPDMGEMKKALEEVAKNVDVAAKAAQDELNKALAGGTSQVKDMLKALEEIVQLRKLQKTVEDSLIEKKSGSPIGSGAGVGMMAGMSQSGKEAAEAEKIAKQFQQLGMWSSEIQEALEAEPELMEALSWKAETMKDIQKEISKEYDAQEKSLMKIKAMTDPDYLRRKAEMEKQITEAKREQEKADAKAKREAERPGFFQKLFQDPKAALGDVMKDFKGFGANIKDEFNRGGIGGLFDSFLHATKGGGGLKGGLSSLLGAVVGGAEGGGFGAAAGAAAGGPMAVAATVALEVAKGLGKLAAIPAKAITGGLELVGNGLRDLQGPLGPIGAGLGLLSSAAEGLAGIIKSIPIVGEIFGPFADALAKIPGLIGDITQSLVNMAAKASPGTFALWQQALDDVQGVIGRTFVPFLEMMREAVRLFGDTLATILPNIQETSEALKPLKDAWLELRDALEEAVGEFGPLIREALIGNLHLLATVIGGVIRSVTLLVEAFESVTSPIMDLLRGLGLVSEEGARTSVRAAAKSARFSSFDEYQKNLIQKAYEIPGTQSRDPAERTVSVLEEIRDLVRDAITRIGNGVGEAADAIAHPGKGIDRMMDRAGAGPKLRGGVAGVLTAMGF